MCEWICLRYTYIHSHILYMLNYLEDVRSAHVSRVFTFTLVAHEIAHR